MTDTITDSPPTPAVPQIDPEALEAARAEAFAALAPFTTLVDETQQRTIQETLTAVRALSPASDSDLYVHTEALKTVLGNFINAVAAQAARLQPVTQVAVPVPSA